MKQLKELALRAGVIGVIANNHRDTFEMKIKSN